MKVVVVVLALVAIVFLVVMVAGYPDSTEARGDLEGGEAPPLAEALARVLPDRRKPVDLRRLVRVRGCELVRADSVLRIPGGPGRTCRLDIAEAEDGDARLTLRAAPGSGPARVAYWLDDPEPGCGDSDRFKPLPSDTAEDPLEIPVLSAESHIKVCPGSDDPVEVTLR